jgi:hypothetical protein
MLKNVFKEYIHLPITLETLTLKPPDTGGFWSVLFYPSTIEVWASSAQLREFSVVPLSFQECPAHSLHLLIMATLLNVWESLTFSLPPEQNETKPD